MGLSKLLLAACFLFTTATAQAGGPSCSDPTTPCPPGSTPGQLPVDVNNPGPHLDAYGTPSGGCSTCIQDPQNPGGRGCTFSEWTSTPPPGGPMAPRLQVQKFLPPSPGATLVQAELRVRATLCGVLRAENRDPLNDCQALLTLATQVGVSPARGQGLDFLAAMLPSLPIEQQQVVQLAIFDGTVDFTGPSGTAVVSSEVQDELCVRITDPAQLDAFVHTGAGSSFLFFDHFAADASSVVGCAPLTFKSDPFAGIELEVTYTYCSSQGPICEGPDHIDGAVGEELVWSWTGSDAGGGLLGFSVSGLPAGAVVTPDPFGGPYPSPLQVTVTWTPDISQTGSYETCVTFTNTAAQGVTCCTSLDVSECHLILATNSGGSAVNIGGHIYQTQVQGVFETHPVMMGMIPSFPLGSTSTGPVPAHATNAHPLIASLVPVRQFVVQVVMFNPDQFPSNPEQSSNGLAVVEWGDGRITATPFGTANNISVRLRVYSDANGNRFYAFPFTILNW